MNTAAYSSSNYFPGAKSFIQEVKERRYLSDRGVGGGGGGGGVLSLISRKNILVNFL